MKDRLGSLHLKSTLQLCSSSSGDAGLPRPSLVQSAYGEVDAGSLDTKLIVNFQWTHNQVVTGASIDRERALKIHSVADRQSWVTIRHRMAGTVWYTRCPCAVQSYCR